MKRGREGQAGLLVALAIVVKPYAVIFLPWLLARRRIVSILSAVRRLRDRAASCRCFATARRNHRPSTGSGGGP